MPRRRELADASTSFPKNKQHQPHWPMHLQHKQLSEILARIYSKSKSNEISDKLLVEFGSLPAALAASNYRLSRISGITDAAIRALKSAQELAEMMAMERLSFDRPILYGFPALLDYLNVMMANAQREEFRILFLDRKYRLIADEVQQVGTVDHTPVYPREVIRRTLELSAIALILVHNHPSGDPAPSAADVRMTREIAEIAKLMGIMLHDHIIIGRSGHASLRSLNLMEPELPRYSP